MHVFTYGSLMFPAVWQRVVRGAYRSAPAVVAEHARFAIAGETYPGMVPRKGASVAGMVYFDVALEDVAALDAFEGPDYRRDRVHAVVEAGAMAGADATVEAGAYVYLDIERLSSEPWRPEEFRMQQFLETYCRMQPRG